MSKVAVLTGSSGQVGSALLATLVENNFYVYGLDKNATNKENESYCIEKVDVADESEVADFFRQLDSKGIKVNVLINNAGIGIFTPFEERSKSDFMSVLEVNLYGPFNMIKASLGSIEKTKSLANIINIASIYGVISSDPSIYEDLNRRNSEVYSASKAGVIQLTKYFAVHLAKENISVNCISPGGVSNNHPKGFQDHYARKCPIGRMAHVSEIVDAVMLFCKNDNAYLTGQNLVVDGGFTAW